MPETAQQQPVLNLLYYIDQNELMAHVVEIYTSGMGGKTLRFRTWKGHVLQMKSA